MTIPKLKKKGQIIPIGQSILGAKLFDRSTNLLIKISTLADMTKEQIQDLRDRVTSLRRHL
ncbi:hypothetical protein GCM10009120_27310 [Sphingobacterium siyangense subsp. cladoniae]